MTVPVKIVPIEDEIEAAWATFLREPHDYEQLGAVKDAFEKGFRAARTFTIEAVT